MAAGVASFLTCRARVTRSAAFVSPLFPLQLAEDNLKLAKLEHDELHKQLQAKKVELKAAQDQYAQDLATAEGKHTQDLATAKDQHTQGLATAQSEHAAEVKTLEGEVVDLQQKLQAAAAAPVLAPQPQQPPVADGKTEAALAECNTRSKACDDNLAGLQRRVDELQRELAAAKGALGAPARQPPPCPLHAPTSTLPREWFGAHGRGMLLRTGALIRKEARGIGTDTTTPLRLLPDCSGLAWTRSGRKGQTGVFPTDYAARDQRTTRVAVELNAKGDCLTVQVLKKVVVLNKKTKADEDKTETVEALTLCSVANPAAPDAPFVAREWKAALDTYFGNFNTISANGGRNLDCAVLDASALR